MLKESVVQSRTREIVESSSVLQYEEYHAASELSNKALTSIEKLIPRKHNKEYKDLVYKYEDALDKTIHVYEMEAYKQGIVDGFEIQSILNSMKK